MRIAVIDVAANNGGALSVLKDFYNYLLLHSDPSDEWYFFLSEKHIEPTKNIHCIIERKTKRSWLDRLIWDNFTFKRKYEQLGFDVVLSLQNAAVSTKCRQFVYFHNLLLVSEYPFSFFRRVERKYAIYSSFISRYTMKTYKNASGVIFQTRTSRDLFFKKYKKPIESYVVNPNVTFNHRTIAPLEHPNGFIYPANPEVFKNHSLIIDAVKILKEEGLEPEVIFTFSKDDSRIARRIAFEAENLKNIKFCGYLPRDEILESYAKYALIWASKIESFPIPFQEVQFVGQYAILPNEDYAIEIMSEYNKTFFYKRDNADDLAEQMKKAMLSNVSPNGCLNRKNSWEDVVKIIKGEVDGHNNYADIQ